MELVRELNEGVPRIFSVMKDAGLPEPEIVEIAANVTVVLRNGKAVADTTQTTTQKILELMGKDPEISIEAIAAQIGITRDGVNYQIKKLKNQGQIERIGGDFGGHWKIIEK